MGVKKKIKPAIESDRENHIELVQALSRKYYDYQGEEELILGDENDSRYWIQKGKDLWMDSEGNKVDAVMAIKYFDIAIEINPLDHIAWMNKGYILRKIHKCEEAIKCYDHAIQIQPNYLNLWLNKGTLLGCVGKIEEALECFEQALKISPGHKMAKKDRQILLKVKKYRRNSKIISKIPKD